MKHQPVRQGQTATPGSTCPSTSVWHLCSTQRTIFDFKSKNTMPQPSGKTTKLCQMLEKAYCFKQSIIFFRTVYLYCLIYIELNFKKKINTEYLTILSDCQ